MIQRNDIEENLKRGILEMLILKMLSQEDMYGYQMINEMNIRGKGLIPIGISCLPMPDEPMILEIMPCTIVNIAIIRSSPHVIAAFASTKRMKSLSACSGRLIS